ncbi:NYN domain-containing protein [Nonomuraea ferruginea]
MRLNVVDLAAQVLGSMPAAAVPPPLRGIAKFDPRKRARLGGAPIAAQLENDKDFRVAVAEHVTAGWPELVSSLAEGNVPPAADPVLVAAAAYLTRPPGWEEMIEAARTDLERNAAAAEGAEREEVVSRLREQLAAQKSAAKEEVDRLREQLKAARGRTPTCAASSTTPVSGRRRPCSGPRRWNRPPRTPGPRPRPSAAPARPSCAGCASAWPTWRNSSKPRAGPPARGAASRTPASGCCSTRCRTPPPGCAGSWRCPPPSPGPPTRWPPSPGRRRACGGCLARALADDDPQLLDQLLALPQVHLIIDGYNVTKTGYGTLTLADQRNRLMTGLGGLVAQTRVEVTVVFDGAELNAPVQVVAPRGVRVLFSAPGEIADDLIRQLVRAEPPGRAMAVVSSDREVAESVRRMGARPVPSALLLRRLGRA